MILCDYPKSQLSSNVVKHRCKLLGKSGKPLDGWDLMVQVFDEKNPVLALVASGRPIGETPDRCVRPGTPMWQRAAQIPPDGDAPYCTAMVRRSPGNCTGKSSFVFQMRVRYRTTPCSFWKLRSAPL